MNSRGAATECSPGREPGVFFRHDLSPRGAKESFGVFRPFGAAFPNDTYPGLAPGAALCRRSAAEYSTGFSPSSLRKFPRPQSQLGQIAVARRECALPTQYLLSELLTHHTRLGGVPRAINSSLESERRGGRSTSRSYLIDAREANRIEKGGLRQHL